MRQAPVLGSAVANGRILGSTSIVSRREDVAFAVASDWRYSPDVPREGDELHGQHGGRLRFVTITEDLLEMEARFTGGGPLPPPHLHPRQDEHFEVLEGAVRVVSDGVQRRYAAGESFDVPAGTVHQMGGDGPARLSWQVRPAQKSAQLTEDLYTGVAAADPAAFLARYADEIRLVEPHTTVDGYAAGETSRGRPAYRRPSVGP